MRRGFPEDEIVRLAEEARVDMIFTSTAGPNGIIEVLQGSNRERVLRRASCTCAQFR